MIKIDLQKEAFELKEYLIYKYNLEPIKIKVKDIRQGHALYLNRTITIPSWSANKGKEYFYYYVIHEFTHFICYDKFKHHGHSPEFKKIETAILKEWGLYPIYAKAYIKELRADNGDILYKRG